MTNRIRRAAAASMVGTTIEWYDFFVFAVATQLVFPHTFFPPNNPTAGTLGSFATFGVAFLVRPLGAAVFGHIGDRAGRKSALIATLLLMGVATFLIGLLPSYSTIGIAAPFLLAALRLCQGFALGGEWGGAVLIIVEHAPKHRRGLYGVFAQLGDPAGFFLANAVMQLIVLTISQEAFLSWGWRIGFLASGVLVLLGLYVRLSVEETALFKDQLRQGVQKKRRIPLAQLITRYPKPLLVSVIVQIITSFGAYGLITYFGTYATRQLHQPASWVLLAGMVGALAGMPAFLLYGWLSDRIGRKPVFVAGAVGWLAVSFPFYWLIQLGSLWSVILASTLAWTVGFGGTYAVQSSLLAELFPTDVRYTGVSMSYQLASVLWSSPIGFVAAWLYTATGSVYSISALVAVGAVVTLAALPLLRETKSTSLAETVSEASAPADKEPAV
jgi:MHS family shikimate/dehydroshikimate transporter-like MFS transporter